MSERPSHKRMLNEYGGPRDLKYNTEGFKETTDYIYTKSKSCDQVNPENTTIPDFFCTQNGCRKGFKLLTECYCYPIIVNNSIQLSGEKVLFATEGDIRIVDGVLCCCDEDNCNSATYIKPTMLIILLVFITTMY